MPNHDDNLLAGESQSAASDPIESRGSNEPQRNAPKPDEPLGSRPTDVDDIDQRVDAAREGIEAVARVYRIHAPTLIVLAKRRLHRARIAEAEYSSDDAVQSSMQTILQQIMAGKLETFTDDDGLLKIVRHLICQKVIAKTISLHALKRTPPRNVRENHRHAAIDDADLEADQQELARAVDRLDLQFCALPQSEVDLASQEIVDKLCRALPRGLQAIVRLRLIDCTVAEAARAARYFKTNDRNVVSRQFG